ncbi:MAG: long-chain fatty acid--CoA ligase [Marinifilaceae bacterium]|jgi:long-chain acyl-CoA synthetase|nr:long-chain fatty acid--CoA ligase [Marinifilaceae bacterium]
MDVYNTIPELINYVNVVYHNKQIFFDKYDNKWAGTTTKVFVNNIQNICLGLHKRGVKPQQTVALIANSNTRWLEFDYAIQCLGAITVPIFPNISIKNLEYEIQDADIKHIILASDEKIDFFKTNSAKFDNIILTDEIDKDYSNEQIIKFSALISLGRELANEQAALFSELMTQVKSDSIATIVYTSGSTGVPKGVVLSQKNLISQVVCVNPIVGIKDDDIALSFLPLAHIFERTIANIYFSCGIPVYWTPDVKLIGELVKEVRPTMMTVVPRFLEKVYAKMKIKLKQSSGFKRILGQWAFKRALEKKVFTPKSILDNIFDKLVYSKLRAALGGRLRKLVAGGAALDNSSFSFYANIGVPIMPGYGLTEFSPVVSTNYENNTKMGTVGKAIENVEVKISSIGEILVKGDSTMQGYHNKPEETAKTIDKEGWLHTGDKGSIDSEGYIMITGRIKEMYKSSTGEYVSPVPIEDRLKKHELIDMAVIVAENRKFTSVLLFPDFENIEYLKSKRKMSMMNDVEFLASPKIKLELQSYINKINKSLNHWEKIQAFKLIAKPLSIENNEITPKLSLSRDVIYNNYKNVIEAIYE